MLEDGRTKLTNFRRMLLTKCQHEFEKDKKDDETLEKMNEAIEQAETVGHCITLDVVLMCVSRVPRRRENKC